MLKKGQLVRIKGIGDLVLSVESMLISSQGGRGNVFELLVGVRPTSNYKCRSASLKATEVYSVRGVDLEVLDSVI